MVGRNKWKIRVAFLCLLLSVLTAFCACGGDTTPQESTTADTTTSEAEIQSPTPGETGCVLVEEGKSRFTVIYPDEPDEVTFAAVKRFCEAVQQKTGVNLKRNVDLIRQGSVHNSETYEILIGYTNYDQTAQALSDIGYGDYVIQQIGHKLVIAGYTPDAVLQAVNYCVSSGLTLDEEKGTLTLGDYAYRVKRHVESFRISGEDLKNYRLIIGDENNRTAAEQLVRDISERYGPVLPILKDKECEPSEYEIRLGATNRDDWGKAEPLCYGYRVSGKTVYLSCGGMHSAGLAVDLFTSRFLWGEQNIKLEDGMMENKMKMGGLPKTEGADLRVMTANILAEFPSWGLTTPVPGRAEILRGILDAYSPDVVGLQEVTPQWYKYWNDYIGDEYTFIYPDTPEGLTNYSSIIYKKDLFTVVEQGLHHFSTNGANHIRLVTWAVLENKQDGRRFAIFNTHWSWGGEGSTRTGEQTAHIQLLEEAEIIRAVVEKYGCPVFCTADYNTKQDTPNYYDFMKEASVEDAKVLARQAGTLLTENGGCGVLGEPHNGVNSIDHIFVTPGMKILSFNTVLDCESASLSDHSPKYADVVLPKQ